MLTFLIQSTLVWLLLLAFYRLFLLNKTFYVINRFYLLASLLTGLCSHFLVEGIGNAITLDTMAKMRLTMPEVNFKASSALSSGNRFSWIWLIYTVGFAFSILKLCYGLFKIYIIKQSGREAKLGNYSYISTQLEHLPFSFLSWVFINPKITSSGIEEILKHEIIHLRQKHSIDILFCELIQCVFWFNPLLILYKKYIKQNHEFIADEETTESIGKENYIDLLLSQSGIVPQPSLSNQFFTSQIKNRITMLLSKKTKLNRLSIYILVVPILIGIGLLLSAFDHQPDKLVNKGCGEIDEMPRFPGCEDKVTGKERETCANVKLFEFIIKNLKYPEEAKKKKVEGMCVAIITISAKGKMEDIKIIKHPGANTDKATMDMLNKMKNDITWIPGKDDGKSVKADITLPVKFKLD